MQADVADEIYRRLCDVAANELLETDEPVLRIGAEDLNILRQVRDFLAGTRARLDAGSDDEECTDYVLEDLSNLPAIPEVEWSVTVVQDVPEPFTWSIAAEEDSIDVDCRRSERSRSLIHIRWKRGERFLKTGELSDWLAGAWEAVANGAKLQLNLN